MHVQAGLFRLYELLFCCLEALGERDLRLTELLQVRSFMWCRLGYDISSCKYASN